MKLGELVKVRGHRKFLAVQGTTEIKYWVLGFLSSTKVVVFKEGTENIEIRNPKETDWNYLSW